MSCTLPEPPEPHHVSAPVLSTRARSGATTLAELTTIGVGGTFTELVEATTETEVVDTVRRADAAGWDVVAVREGAARVIIRRETEDDLFAREADPHNEETRA